MFRLTTSQSAIARVKGGVSVALRAKTSKSSNGIDIISVGPAGVAAGVTVYIRGGSAVESHQTAGATHAMKFLAYQRSGLRTQRELAILGASLSVEAGREAIKFQSTFQKKDLGSVVELLSGFVSPRLEEYEVRDSLPLIHADAAAVNGSRLHQLVDGVHAATFGYRGLGADEHARPDSEISVQHLRRWVHDTYHAKNIVVVGVGIEHSELEEAVNNSFSEVSEGTEKGLGSFKIPSVPGWPDKPDTTYPLQVPASGSSYLAVAWRGPSRGHNDYAKLAVLAQVLGDVSETRREQGFWPGSGVTALLASAQSGASAAHPLHFAYGNGSLFGAFVQGEASSNSYVPALSGVFKQFATARDEVLQKAILQTRRRALEQLDTVSGQLDFFDSQVVLPNIQKPQAYLAELEALKPEQIREVALRFAKFAPSSMVTIGNVSGRRAEKSH